MRIYPAIFLILFTALPGYTEKPAVEKIDVKYDEQKLVKGDLQLFEQTYNAADCSKKKRIIGMLLINAHPDTVWKCIEDWDSMGSFVPGVVYQKTKIKLNNEKNKYESIIECKLNVTFFMDVFYILRINFDKTNYKQDWILLTKDEITNYNKQGFDIKENSRGLKSVDGFEYLEPYSNGSQTIFFYSPIVEISIPIPGFVEKFISEKSVSDFMFAIKKRAETK